MNEGGPFCIAPIRLEVSKMFSYISSSPSRGNEKNFLNAGHGKIIYKLLQLVGGLEHFL